MSMFLAFLKSARLKSVFWNIVPARSAYWKIAPETQSSSLSVDLVQRQRQRHAAPTTISRWAVGAGVEGRWMELGLVGERPRRRLSQGVDS